MAGISTGPMAGKTVLVTGGTGGIGKATAAGLAAMGARVGITGRDPARTWAAAADVATASGNPAVDPFAVDVSSQAEVRRLAGEVLYMVCRPGGASVAPAQGGGRGDRVHLPGELRAGVGERCAGAGVMR